jgi:anti-sigma B factor antagonist
VAEGTSELGITVAKEGPETVIGLRGDLDLYTAAQLRARLLDLIVGPTTRLVIDLAELDFVDSTGLGTLVSVVQRVRHVGGEMTLRSPTPATRSVIEMTGLARVLPIRD